MCQKGATSGHEEFVADGDDDSDVDQDDYDILAQYYSNSLDLFDIST